MPVSAAEDFAPRCYVVTDQMTYAVASTLDVYKLGQYRLRSREHCSIERDM